MILGLVLTSVCPVCFSLLTPRLLQKEEGKEERRLWSVFAACFSRVPPQLPPCQRCLRTSRRAAGGGGGRGRGDLNRAVIKP
jgi:hypothetical protein